MQLKRNIVLPLVVTAGVMFLFFVSFMLESGALGNDHAGWAEMGQGSASGGGISDNAGESGWPAVALLNDTPYVSWYDDTSGDEEIYVRRWQGGSWGEVGANSASLGGISRNSGNSTAPSIAAGPQGMPCVGWRDFSSGHYEVYVRCWNGSGWAELGAGSATGGGVSNQQGTTNVSPSLAAAPNGTLYVAWDNAVGGSSEIYVARWNGSAWQRLPAGGNVSNTPGDSWQPSLSVAPNGTPYVAWQDESGTDSEIYVRRWNGSSWVEVGAGSATWGGVSRNSGNSARASLTFSAAGTPYVAWQDDSSGNYEIYIRRWNGSSWVEVGSGAATGSGISDNASASLRPSVAMNESDEPCVVWQDRPQQHNEVYLRCWSGSDWREVDTGSATGAGISANSGESSAPRFVVDSDNRGYVAWGDNSSGNYEIYVRSRLLSGEANPTPTTSAVPSATPTTTPTTVPSATPAPLQLNFMPAIAKLFTGHVAFPERVRFLPIILRPKSYPTSTPVASPGPPPPAPTQTPPAYPYPYPYP